MFTHLKHLTLRFTRLPVLFVFLYASGCATNHVHPEFDKRIAETKKITGLIVQLESTGLKRGGLKHTPLHEDEFAMWAALNAMQKLFSEQQLQQMGAAPTLYLPEELIGLGYKKNEAEHDTKLLAGLLKSAVSNPGLSVRADELEAVRRLAVRSGGDILLLGEIRTSRHMSDESRSFANFLAILAAAGGQYGITAGQDEATSKWTIVDPDNGNILRALQDSLHY